MSELPSNFDVYARINAALQRQDEARAAARQARLAFEADARNWLSEEAARGNKYAEFIVEELENLEAHREDY